MRSSSVRPVRATARGKDRYGQCKDGAVSGCVAGRETVQKTQVVNQKVEMREN